jgi:uncharacterized protein (TIGR03437 family)
MKIRFKKEIPAAVRTLGLLVLLCLAGAAYIVGADTVPQGPAGGSSTSQVASRFCNPPTIASVENGASDSATVSPGSVAIILWCDNAIQLPATPVTSVLVNGLPSYLYPSLATPVTSVLANGLLSYLQVRVQIPVEVNPGNANVQLKQNTQVLAQTEINLSTFAPGIFTADGSGQGLAIAEHSNGKLITAACPAIPGEAITLYAEGLGPTTPPVATGALPPGLNNTNTVPTLTVGGLQSSVLIAYLSTTLVGVDNIEFVVPAVGSGQQPVQINIGGESSNTAQLPVGSKSCGS